MLWYFSKWLVFLSLCWKQEGTFTHLYCEHLFELLEVKLMEVLVPLPEDWVVEFSFLRLVHTEPLAIHQLQYKFSYPSTGSRGFCLLVSTQVSCNSLCPPVCFCTCGVSSLPCDLTSPTYLKRIIGFFQFA